MTYVTQTIDNGVFEARRIDDELEWGLGTIGAEADQSDEAQVARAHLALDAIAEVPRYEMNATGCTDGRTPAVLENGELVPVRPTLPGESLGDAYYAYEAADLLPDSLNAGERVWWTAENMRAVGIKVNVHLGCAACAGYGAVKENGIAFADVEGFRRRQEQTLPTGVYSKAIQEELISNQRRQLRRKGYEEPTLETFLHVAREFNGPAAVASYADDGRGQSGHIESDIFILNTPGYAVNSRVLNESGNQAFTVNNDVAARNAEMLAFVAGERQLALSLRQAMNMHASATHGTLTKNVPTWVVQKIKKG